MELLAWELRRPNALTWELQSFVSPQLQFWWNKYYVFYHSAICASTYVIVTQMSEGRLNVNRNLATRILQRFPKEGIFVTLNFPAVTALSGFMGLIVESSLSSWTVQSRLQRLHVTIHLVKAQVIQMVPSVLFCYEVIMNCKKQERDCVSANNAPKT